MTKKEGYETLKRPPWDHYFMEVAYVVASRSTCLRRKIGAVIVKDRRILTTGYNGPPSGITHCDVRGCLRERLNVPSGERHELCWGLHAEQNAIIQAALHGVSLKDASIYVTAHPCSVCAKMIINSGIKEVVYHKGYPDSMARELFKEAKLTVRKLENFEPGKYLEFLKMLDI